MYRHLIIFLLLFFLFKNVSGQSTKIDLKIPIGHSSVINSVAFSPDGKFIATGSSDNSAIIWDVKTGREVKTFNLSDKVQRVIFTPDNKSLITVCSPDANGFFSKTKIIIWNIHSGDSVKCLLVSSIPGSLNITPNGQMLIYQEGGLSMTVKVFDIKNNIEYGSLPVGLFNLDNTIPVTHDSKFFITTAENLMYNSPLKKNGDKKYQINIWSIDSGKTQSKNQAQGLKINRPEPTRTLQFGNSELKAMTLSGDGKYLAAGASNGVIKVWNLTKATDTLMFKTKDGAIHEMAFSKDGSKLLTYSSGKKIVVWNLKQDDKTPHAIQLQNDKKHHEVRFHPEGNIFVRVNSKEAYLMSLTNGQIIRELKGHTFPVTNYFFNIDSLSVITSYDDAFLNDRMEFDSLGKLGGGLLAEIMHKENKNFSTASQPDKDSIASRFHQSLINNRKKRQGVLNPRVWNFVTGEVDNFIKDTSHLDPKLKKVGNYTLTCEKYSTGTGSLMKLATGMMDALMKKDSIYNNDNYAKTISDSSGLMNKMAYDTNSVFNKINGPVVKLINSTSGDTFLLMSLDTSDWVITDRKGYFMSSKNGSSELHYVVNGKVYLFDQFDLQFNRPDKILAEIGLASSSTIGEYRNAVLGRWLEMKVDTSRFEKEINFNAPQLEIIFPQGFNYTTQNPDFKFKIKASDNSEAIRAVEVWVNGSPVFGKEGMSLNTNNSKQIEKELNVKLTKGNNIIDVAVRNLQSIRSYKERFEVNYNTDDPTRPDLYLITMGVSQYDNPSWNDLKYAAKDADDINRLFIEISHSPDKPFANLIPIHFTDEKVTFETIKKIKEQLKNSKPEDNVLIFFSGHGVRNKKGDLLLGTTSMGTAENDFQNSIPFAEINSLMADITARQKLVLIDACQSGRVNAMVQQTGKNDKTITLKESKGEYDEIPASKNAISAEKMFTDFANLSGNNGATVIGATGGDKPAYEEKIFMNGAGKTIENGVFTFFIKECFIAMSADLNKDNHTDVEELKKYIIENTKLHSDPDYPQEAMCIQENPLGNWMVK